MAWTAEDRRTYAPAMQEMVRRGMIVRLAQTRNAIDPQPKAGRRRVWSTLIMLQALWHLARDGCTWRRLPATFPPPTTVWSRLHRWRWRRLAALDRALAVLVACLRLARGRKRVLLVDTEGNPLGLRVVPADRTRASGVSARRAAPEGGEQTFGCLQRYRRLRVDDEMSCESSRGMALLAALFLTGMRLERLIGS